MINQEENMIMDKYETIARLADIREEMCELLNEADRLVRSEFPYEYENARSYWIGHLKSALGGYDYHTYSTTFLSCLESLDEIDEDEYMMAQEA